MSAKKAIVDKDTYHVLHVTKEQYAHGYLERIGAVTYQRSYVPLKELEDGTWIVFDPDDYLRDER